MRFTSRQGQRHVFRNITVLALLARRAMTVPEVQEALEEIGGEPVLKGSLQTMLARFRRDGHLVGRPVERAGVGKTYETTEYAVSEVCREELEELQDLLAQGVGGEVKP